jgi:hypothetical protein
LSSPVLDFEQPVINILIVKIDEIVKRRHPVGQGGCGFSATTCNYRMEVYSDTDPDSDPEGDRCFDFLRFHQH